MVDRWLDRPHEMPSSIHDFVAEQAWWAPKMVWTGTSTPMWVPNSPEVSLHPGAKESEEISAAHMRTREKSCDCNFRLNLWKLQSNVFCNKSLLQKVKSGRISTVSSRYTRKIQIKIKHTRKVYVLRLSSSVHSSPYAPISVLITHSIAAVKWCGNCHIVHRFIVLSATTPKWCGVCRRFLSFLADNLEAETSFVQLYVTTRL